MKNILRLALIVTPIMASLLSCSVAEPPADLEWRNGWVRALPPGAGMTAAYGELRNNSKNVIELTTWDSDAFAHVSLHQTVVEDGVSRMREQVGIQIAAGESLSLEPGRMHLMLMQSTREISEGNKVEIGLSSADQRFVFSLPVKAR